MGRFGHLLKHMTQTLTQHRCSLVCFLPEFLSLSLFTFVTSSVSRVSFSFAVSSSHSSSTRTRGRQASKQFSFFSFLFSFLLLPHSEKLKSCTSSLKCVKCSSRHQKMKVWTQKWADVPSNRHLFLKSARTVLHIKSLITIPTMPHASCLNSW